MLCDQGAGFAILLGSPCPPCQNGQDPGITGEVLCARVCAHACTHAQTFSLEAFLTCLFICLQKINVLSQDMVSREAKD